MFPVESKATIVKPIPIIGQNVLTQKLGLAAYADSDSDDDDDDENSDQDEADGNKKRRTAGGRGAGGVDDDEDDDDDRSSDEEDSEAELRVILNVLSNSRRVLCLNQRNVRQRDQVRLSKKKIQILKFLIDGQCRGCVES